MKEAIANILVILTSITIMSCSKENFLNSTEYNYYDTEQAMVDFSVILSKAVYNEPQLRDFIKREALKSFDRDFDVFYPWTKSIEVRDGLSFEEILKIYDESSRLSSIEKALPLLNILAPDWSWISDDCFSVKTWNTDINEVGVGYRSYKPINDIYANGVLQTSIPAGAFPDFPVLIVKENERMQQNTNYTKGRICEYDFIDSYFDINNQVLTKGDGVVTEIFDYPFSESGDVLPVTLLEGRLITVYNETENVIGLPQRDNIYYNMTFQRDTGIVDYNYCEKLLKFRFTTPVAAAIYDDPVNSSTTGQDFVLKDYWITKENTNNINKTWYTYDQLALMDWGEGAIEVKFEIYAGDERYAIHKTISFEEAFFVKRIYQIREENWLGANMYRHYFTEKDCLQPKWITVNSNLFTWNLSEYPTRYQVVVKECDKGSKRERTFQTAFSYATNFKVVGDTSSSKMKLGWEFGASSTSTSTSTYTESYNEEDDEFGAFWVHYADKFILNQNSSEVVLRKYTIGDIELIIMPARL